MRALVVDDEPHLRRAVQVGLEQNGYEVFVAGSGPEALEQAALQMLDVVILDLAMPGMDGFEVCRRLRERSKVPILVLSVRDGEEDKIAALDLGADDYLTKPFGLGELLARLRALLRRTGGTDEAEHVFKLEGLSLDFTHRRVSLNGEEVHLTPIEYELLRVLALNLDRVLTHRQLLTRVWGEEYAEDLHTLRVHIANLRAKIEPDAIRPRFIYTEPRVGYRLRSSR